MLLSEFRTVYPEFANAPDSVIDAYLTSATNLTPAEFWGDQQDLGIGLLVAHWLSIKPTGKHARLSSSTAESTYGAERLRLAMDLPARGLLL